jgi:hypothetical protein
VLVLVLVPPSWLLADLGERASLSAWPCGSPPPLDAARRQHVGWQDGEAGAPDS